MLLMFSHSVMSNSLRPHGLQHARLDYPSPSPGACSNSCPLSWWCHPTNHLILCCPLLLLPSIFPSIRVFSNESAPPPMASGGQSMVASASVLSVNILGWFSLRLTGLISLLHKGCSRVFSSTTVRKHQFFGPQPSLWPNSHIHTWLLEKP